MPRYIDADALLRKFNIDDMCTVNECVPIRIARRTIENAPTADVAEVRAAVEDLERYGRNIHTCGKATACTIVGQDHAACYDCPDWIWRGAQAGKERGVMSKEIITEARELCEKWSLSDYTVFECEDCIANMVIYKVVELCDALEKANAQIESIHKSLDFAETQRQKSKNYTELAINNGLALGRIAVTIQHDFGPLPAASRKGTRGND